MNRVSINLQKSVNTTIESELDFPILLFEPIPIIHLPVISTRYIYPLFILCAVTMFSRKQNTHFC